VLPPQSGKYRFVPLRVVSLAVCLGVYALRIDLFWLGWPKLLPLAHLPTSHVFHPFADDWFNCPDCSSSPLLPPTFNLHITTHMKRMGACEQSPAFITMKTHKKLIEIVFGIKIVLDKVVKICQVSVPLQSS
jgi:hypothetical protein